MSAEPTQLSPARPPLTRDGVVTAARSIIATSGLDALSLRRLASDLGVTAPALYAHVRDKADLFEALAEVGFRELLGRYDEIRTDDALERIRRQCEVYVDLALLDPGLFRVMFMFRPNALAVPGVDNELPAATEAFEHGVAAIAAAIDDGAIHPDHDPMTTAMSMWTVAHGLATVLLLGVAPDPATRATLQDSVLGSTLRGFRTNG